MSLYHVSVPTFTRTLTSLRNILVKAVAQAAERNIDEAVLVNARLAPDMFPLSRQVQVASDSAKRAAGQLAGVEIPVFADDETTFAELIARIDKTLEFLGTLPEAAFEGAEARIVELPLPSGSLKLDGTSFLMGFGMANFFFHAVTAYDILRHNGIQIGKMDFLGAP